MSGVVAVDIDAKELDEVIAEYAERGGDLTGVMAIIAEDLAAAVADMYQTSGHGQWPPLAEATIARRRMGSARPMVDTGVLMRSTVAASGADFAEAYTAIEYVRFHLEGGPVIPKRNPFDLPEDVYDEAVDLILAHIAGEAAA